MLMGDMMSQALVALLALAQINLLSPVNTPFPGRIWASDTFIFSGIWENTRGGFWHSVRRQAWAFMFCFSLCVTCEPLSLRASELMDSSANNAFYVTRCMTWTDEPVWSSFFGKVLLAQFCHKVVVVDYVRVSSRKWLALFSCFHTF